MTPAKDVDEDAAPVKGRERELRKGPLIARKGWTRRRLVFGRLR